MAKEVKKSSKIWKWFFIIIIIVGVTYFGRGLLVSYDECDTWECFDSHLETCDRAEFIGGQRMIFEYKIEGKSGDDCEVNVELLQGELNNQESTKLEGHKMNCMLPYGVVMIPESDISNCHGLLKEGLQDLVIQKLHNYVVQNLGRINLEALEV
tara:strand:+ start:510 stop:971 length:462 start_codon:yes stop_codon:yes gene_type:complete